MEYLGCSVTYTRMCPCTVDLQTCDMSVSNPLVTPIHNGTTCINMVKFLQNGCMHVLKDSVDMKERFYKNLTKRYIGWIPEN